MSFSIKNILSLGILFFTCFFLYGAEAVEEGLDLAKYHFYENEDCIKIKIVFPAEATSTLYKINNPDSKGVAVQIKNDVKCLENFYQLVDIEVHAVSSQEQGGVTFEIIEALEKKPTNKTILKDSLTSSSKYFVKTDKQVDFKGDVTPTLTGIRGAPHMKYVRFFTKPSLN